MLALFCISVNKIVLDLTGHISCKAAEFTGPNNFLHDEEKNDAICCLW